MICQLGLKIFPNPLRRLHGGQIAVSSLWPTPFKHNWQSCTVILIQLRCGQPPPPLTMRYGCCSYHFWKPYIQLFFFTAYHTARSASLPIPALVLAHLFPSLHRWRPLITFQSTVVSVYWSPNDFNVKGALFFSSSLFESTASKIKKNVCKGGGHWVGRTVERAARDWTRDPFRSACLQRNGAWGARWIWMRTMKRATRKKDKIRSLLYGYSSCQKRNSRLMLSLLYAKRMSIV